MDQSITIKIAGNEYPLKAATPQIEQMMRIAAETIGKKLSAYDANRLQTNFLSLRSMKR